jgi:hypothetical protein
MAEGRPPRLLHAPPTSRRSSHRGTPPRGIMLQAYRSSALKARAFVPSLLEEDNHKRPLNCTKRAVPMS